MAQAIISSWNAIIPAHPLVHIHDNSIGAIGWDTFHAFMFHLKHNVSPSLSGGGIILIPLLLSAAYYLFTNYMVYFSRGTAEERNAKRMEISLLYPVFCLTLIPMLTVLSCDTGRIFQYATITTFSAFLILPQQRVCGMFPGWYKTIIGRFNNWLDRRFPPTKTSLIFILLILAVNPYHFNLNGCWTESVIGSIISNCLNICAKLVKIFLWDDKSDNIPDPSSAMGEKCVCLAASFLWRSAVQWLVLASGNCYILCIFIHRKFSLLH